LSAPSCVRVDAGGNLYISDSGNSVIREVNAAGIITTIAGKGGQFESGGDGGVATSAQLNSPAGIAVDPAGNVYIADQGNMAVREVAVSGMPMSFTSTAVGSISNQQTISVVNTGNEPLTFASLTISPDFQQQSSGAIDCVATLSLGAGTSCSIAVVFAPQADGNLSGNLAFTTNSLNVPATQVQIQLSGAANGPAGSDPVLNATTLSFGNDGTSGAQTVTLSNPGSTAIAFAGISLSGSDFVVKSTTCGSTLAANNSCNVVINFTPTATGLRTAFLNLTEQGPQVVFEHDDGSLDDGGGCALCEAPRRRAGGAAGAGA
jgi:hypothetical protein